MKTILFGRTNFAAECMKTLYHNEFEVLFIPSITKNPQEKIVEKENIKLANSLGFKTMSFSDFMNNHKKGEISKVNFIFSALHSSIIKDEIIKIAENGVVNFHASPTPPIRGFAGYTAAYLKKMTYWGATSFFIVNEGIDNGPIIIRKTFKFDWKIGTALSLKKKTFPVLLEVMKETIQRLKEGNYEATKQPQEYLYFSKKEFEEKKLITDSDSIQDIELKCRAYWYPPYEGAIIIKNGKRFTIAPYTLMSDLDNFNL